MNSNQIVTDGFSDADSEQLYRNNWPDQPAVAELYSQGMQCECCAFYAKFNADYGLCCNAGSQHRLETVFEHFSCAAHKFHVEPDELDG